MDLPLHQVDAFASAVFGGNRAAVVFCTEPLSAEFMRSVAMENRIVPVLKGVITV